MEKNANERVRQLREALAISQTEMATHLDVSVSLISKIESSGIDPSVKLLKKMSEKYGINQKWLLTGEGVLKVNLQEKSFKSENPYENYAIQRLELEAETWQQKYNDLFQLLNKVLSGNMGKFKALSFPGSLKNDRKRVHVN